MATREHRDLVDMKAFEELANNFPHLFWQGGILQVISYITKIYTPTLPRCSPPTFRCGNNVEVDVDKAKLFTKY